MSKRFRGKTCVYCGEPGVSTTADHVFARQFVLGRHRANMPKVPACKSCNEQKARFEHHLTAVLPIGARHSDAAEILKDVPRRLSKNRPLQASVDRTIVPRFMPAPSGLLVKTGIVLVEADTLLSWAAMVVKGLVWHHWRVAIGSNHEVTARLCSGEEAALLELLFTAKGVTIPRAVLGNGALVYAAHAKKGDMPTSIWRLSVYGVELGGADPRIRTTNIHVIVDGDRAGSGRE